MGGLVAVTVPLEQVVVPVTVPTEVGGKLGVVVGSDLVVVAGAAGVVVGAAEE